MDPKLPVKHRKPLLQPGDMLSWAEFERRYEGSPDCKKAELIEGVVYMPSPVRFHNHANPHLHLCTWLGVFQSKTPGVQAGDNGSNRLDEKNVSQPDCMLFVLPECGGKIRFDEDYIVGPPEFVAEVSGSTVALDRGPKRRVFRRHGVQEYLIWRVEDRLLEWNSLHQGKYRLLQPDTAGIYRSAVFPGLWLDSLALLSGDLARVLATLQAGLDSPEHLAFVAELSQRRTK